MPNGPRTDPGVLPQVSHRALQTASLPQLATAIPRREVGLVDPALHGRTRFPLRAVAVCQPIPHVNGPTVSECRVGGGAPASGLASVRRSNLACGRRSRTGLSQRCVTYAAPGSVQHGRPLRLLDGFSSHVSSDIDFWVFHKRNLSTAASLLTGFPLRANHFGPSPSPAHCAASCEVTPLSRRFWYCSTVRRLAKHRFPFRSRL